MDDDDDEEEDDDDDGNPAGDNPRGLVSVLILFSAGVEGRGIYIHTHTYIYTRIVCV